MFKVSDATQTVEKGLLEEDLYWQKPKWKQDTDIEIKQVKMCGDFEYKIRKETTARRPDVTIKCTERKLIQIIDMACTSNRNINKKVN